MSTTLSCIMKVLDKYPLSPKDFWWIKKNVRTEQLQILSSEPKNLIVDKSKLNWFLSSAQFIVQHGRVVQKEFFDPKRSGLIIIRPGVIHIYIV